MEKLVSVFIAKSVQEVPNFQFYAVNSIVSTFFMLTHCSALQMACIITSHSMKSLTGSVTRALKKEGSFLISWECEEGRMRTSGLVCVLIKIYPSEKVEHLFRQWRDMVMMCETWDQEKLIFLLIRPQTWFKTEDASGFSHNPRAR